MSVPVKKYPPLGLVWEKGMWIYKGGLRGKACWNYKNKNLVGIDPTVDGSGLTNGSYMFNGCTGLREWNIELPNIQNGSYMFYGCTGLREWNTELPNLTSGSWMFYACNSLVSFNANLSSLTDGSYMFYNCSNLEIVNMGILPKLKTARGMFHTTKIASFEGDLSRITDGYELFYSCSRFTDFKAVLTSLNSGGRMFEGCKLNLESLQRVASTIRTHMDGSVRNIPIGVDSTLVSQEQQDEINALMSSKGWTVQWKRN